MTGFSTFGADELHTLDKTTFDVEADKIPAGIRCTCLHGGQFCLTALHWILEFGRGNPL
jgi:hypothetical protein